MPSGQTGESSPVPNRSSGGGSTISKRVRVFIIDDRPLSRAAVREALSRDPALEVIGEAAPGHVGDILALPVPPDVVVIGRHGSGAESIALIQRLHRHSQGIKVLLLAASTEADYVVRAVEAGVDGYLLQDTSPAEMARAARQVAGGAAPFHLSAARVIVDELARSARHAARAEMRDRGLTDREIDVLTLLASGLHDHQIARALFVSTATVKTHLRSLFRKLNVHSRVLAAAIAIRHRLALPDDSFPPR